MQQEPKLVPNTPIGEEKKSGKKGLLFNSNVMTSPYLSPKLDKKFSSKPKGLSIDGKQTAKKRKPNGCYKSRKKVRFWNPSPEIRHHLFCKFSP